MKENLEDTILLKAICNNEEVVNIKNQELNKFIQYKLGKNQFNREELNKIKYIKLSGKTLTKKDNIIYFNELELFPNIEEIEISYTNIDEKDLEKMLELKKITFRNCNVETIKNLTQINELSLISTNIGDTKELECLTQLKSLELINLDIEDFDFLEKMPNLNKLIIKNISNFNMNKIKSNLQIEYLSVEDIEDLKNSDIEKFDKLKTLSVDRLKKEEWKLELDKIVEKGITVMLNDIYKY